MNHRVLHFRILVACTFVFVIYLIATHGQTGNAQYSPEMWSLTPPHLVSEPVITPVEVEAGTSTPAVTSTALPTQTPTIAPVPTTTPIRMPDTAATPKKKGTSTPAVTSTALPTQTPTIAPVPTATARPRLTPTTVPLLTPTPTETWTAIHDIQAPFDWYVWQGQLRPDKTLQFSAATNCGPSVVSMAVRYASNNTIRPTPEDVRTVIPRIRGTTDGTYPEDEIVALQHWQIPWRDIETLAEIEQAIAANHIVLISLDMVHISPGADLVEVSSCEDETCLQINGQAYAYTNMTDIITGRYNPYTGRHAVVIKGVVIDDDGKKYFVVYDPNVWTNGGTRYYYLGDERYPRGMNRLYAYDEVERGFVKSFKAQEILATPWNPITSANAQSPETLQPIPTISHPFWCYQANSTHVQVRWCNNLH